MLNTDRINVTGMQSCRLILREVLPDEVNNLPHNWQVGEVKQAVRKLSRQRRSTVRIQAMQLLESMLGEPVDFLED